MSFSSLSFEMYLPFQAQLSANSETSGKSHLKQHAVFNKCGGVPNGSGGVGSMGFPGGTGVKNLPDKAGGARN